MHGFKCSVQINLRIHELIFSLDFDLVFFFYFSLKIGVTNNLSKKCKFAANLLTNIFSFECLPIVSPLHKSLYFSTFFFLMLDLLSEFKINTETNAFVAKERFYPFLSTQWNQCRNNSKTLRFFPLSCKLFIFSLSLNWNRDGISKSPANITAVQHSWFLFSFFTIFSFHCLITVSTGFLADEKKKSVFFSVLLSNLGRETYHVDCSIVNDYYSQNPRSNWYLIPFDRLR